MMASAMADLGLLTSHTITMSGSERLGRQVTSFATRISVRKTFSSAGYTTLLEMVSAKDRSLLSRFVANGSYLYYYNREKHEYSSWSYGDGSTQDPDYAMLMTLGKLASASDTVLTKALTESHQAQIDPSRLANSWNPWLATAKVTVAGNMVTTTSTSPNFREVQYMLTEPTPGYYRLDRIQYYEEKPTGSDLAIIQWTATVLRNTLVSGTDFTFVPGNAKPVSIQLRQSAGGG